MTNRITALVLAALPAAACLSAPPYLPLAAVSYTADGTGTTAGATVAAPGFTLHFATGDHFHFPDRLEVGSTDVLGHDQSAACFDANETGFQISPSYRISGDSGATGTAIAKNQLDPVLRGPAVVQIKLDWAMHLGTTSRTPGGTSTFTAFLDGRIVRHDRIDDPSTVRATAGGSACTDRAPSAFSVSSYWTFARAFPGLYTGHRAGDPLTQQTADQQPEINDDLFACFDAGASAFQVASAVRIPDDNDAGDLMSLRINDRVFTFAHFLFLSNSDLRSLQWDDHSAVFIEHGGCMAGSDRANLYLAPPSLAINTKPVPFSENDGIYGGDSGDGHPGYALETDHADLTGTVPGSFAVWLRFKSSVDLVRATRKGGAAPTGPWYIPQQVDSSTWIVWFRDPLAATQTITIEPD